MAHLLVEFSSTLSFDYQIYNKFLSEWETSSGKILGHREARNLQLHRVCYFLEVLKLRFHIKMPDFKE
jgi:hypothetical protein